MPPHQPLATCPTCKSHYVLAPHGVILHPDSRQVVVAGRSAKLSKTTYRIFAYLVQHTEKFTMTTELSSLIYGPRLKDATKNRLQVQMSFLRSQIHDLDCIIIARKGKGYRLCFVKGAPLA